MDDLLTPPFDTKIAVLVRDDLEPWQRLNVTAFLVSGVKPRTPSSSGSRTPTPTGTRTSPFSGCPSSSSRVAPRR